MIFGAALGIVAAGFAVLAWLLAGPEPAEIAASVFFGWHAFAAAFVAAGYVALEPRVFGKSTDGRRALWARILLIPYFGGVAIARFLQRTITGEPPYHLVAPGLYVGRLVAKEQLPDDVALVVDLTAELTEPKDTRDAYAYRCLPTLDGTAPEVPKLRAFVDDVNAHPGPTYVHCAAGHGRAAMVTAILLVRRGLAEDIRAAERFMRTHRPKVRMTRHQRRHAAKAV